MMTYDTAPTIVPSCQECEAQQTEEISSVTKEAEELKGKSWYDADQEHRQRSNRLSITRVVFACLLLPEVTRMDDDVTTIKDVEVKQDEEEARGRLDIASRLKDFITDTIMPHIDIRGGVALLSKGSGGIGTDAMNTTCSPSAALGFVELQSPSDAENLIVRLSKNNDGEKSVGLRSIRILLCTDDCPCYELPSSLSSSSFAIYHASPPHEEDDIDIRAEGPTAVVGDIMKNLCSTGEQMDRSSSSFSSLLAKDRHREEDESGGTDDMIQSLTGPRRKSLPSARRVVTCSQSSFYPTIEEYIEIFCYPIIQSINLNLESDGISPILPVIDWDALIREGIVPGLNDDTTHALPNNGLLNYDGRHNKVSVI